MKNILFVISYPFKTIGGHLISAATLARFSAQRGHKVGLLVAPLNFELDAQDKDIVTIHDVPFESRRRAYFSRPPAIYRAVRSYGYDCIVAMDWMAAFEAAPTAMRYGLPLVQVEAGGPVKAIPFIWTPGLVVFSEELLEGISKRYNLSFEDLVLATGRVDFDYFSESSTASSNISLGFDLPYRRVLTVSRLDTEKEPALLALFGQVYEAAKTEAVQLVVVGDGARRDALERQASEMIRKTNEQAQIQFTGGLRVTAEELRQAELVVGQGRTVIEAVACGTPAAVCGNEGYCGVVTAETFSALVSSNLTGRGQRISKNLADDLRILPQYRALEFRKVQSSFRQIFDARQGAEAIEKAISLQVAHHPESMLTKRRLAAEYFSAWRKIFRFHLKKQISERTSIS